MKIKKILFVILTGVISVCLSTSIFASEAKMASSVETSAPLSGSHDYTRRIVGQAFNSDIGGGATVTVVVNVDTTSLIEYHWENKTDCYADKTTSSFIYETSKYNPEVCTYGAGLGSQDVTQSGFSQTYTKDEMTGQPLWLPKNHWGQWYDYYHDNLLINFPISVKGNYIFNWSDNVVPAAVSFSNTFTLTEPQ